MRMWAGLTCAALLGAAACGGSSSSSTSAPPPGSAKAASGEVKPSTATLDVTATGAVNGSSTTLATDKTSECPGYSAAKMIGTYAINLYPMIGGKRMHFAVLVGRFSGPTTLTLPDDAGKVTAYLADDDSSQSRLFNVNKNSSGTLTLTESGGSLDVKHLEGMMNAGTLDLKASWTCR